MAIYGIGTGESHSNKHAELVLDIACSLDPACGRLGLLRRLREASARYLSCDLLGFAWLESSRHSLFAADSADPCFAFESCLLGATDSGTQGDLPSVGWSLYRPRLQYKVVDWLTSQGVDAVAVAEVQHGQGDNGLLIAGRFSSQPFPSKEKEVLSLMAAVAGSALASTLLRDQIAVMSRDLTLAKGDVARLERRRADGEFTTAVAHDLNNILTLISARVEIMRLQQGPSSAQASLGAIAQAVDDGIALVRRVTRAARVDREHRHSKLDLNRLVGDAVDMTRPRWDNRLGGSCPITVRLDLGTVSTVLGTASELREVLVNLIVNALDAMPRGGNIDISTHGEGAWSVVEVSDQGHGMEESLRQRIFEPFFSTKGEAGTGLGLWVSRELISNHGGDITVESRPGIGSTFKIRLPSSRSMQQGMDHTTRTARPAILLLGRENAKEQAVRAALEMAGYQVLLCTEPADSLEPAALQGVGALIVEIDEQADPAYLKSLSSLKGRFPSLPLIALEDLDGELNPEVRVDEVIRKPFGAAELRTKVARLLADSSSS